MSRIIRIQPKARPDMTLPYPLFIDEKGKVGRQDFWKGKPVQLIGFDITPTDHGRSGKAVTLEQFLADPIRCVGMYPILKNTGGKWVTWNDPIASYSISAEDKTLPGAEKAVTKKGKSSKKSK